MGADSKIEWTHHTFNPWRGCARVSLGCEHCYAETLSKRNPKTLGTWGVGGTRVVAAEAYWKQAIRWNREASEAGERRRVFCASLADVFEDWRGHVLDTEGNVLWVNPGGQIIRAGLTPVGNPIAQGYRTATLQDVRFRLWTLIHDTPHLDWLLLTKRPENVNRFSAWCDGRNGAAWPTNIWLGTTCEDQQRADERIPHLLAVPAAVRFLSVEPMLGPVDLSQFLGGKHERRGLGVRGSHDGRAADRPGRDGLEALREEGGSLARGIAVDPMRAEAGGARDAAGLPSGARDHRRQATPLTGASPGVPALQRPDSRGADDQSPERRAIGQPSGEPRTGDAVRAEAALNSRARVPSGEELPSISWVIVGGESGAGARPFDVAWARDIVQQTREAGVACFVKQLGAHPSAHETRAAGGKWVPMVEGSPIHDPKGGDPAEWPEDLRVREFPR